jgi:phage gpG-like protein
MNQFVRITILGLDEARNSIEQFPRRCQAILRTHSVLRDIGTVFVSSAVQTINAGGRPPYKPLAESTTAAKLNKYKKSSHILVAGGQLRQSLDYDVAGGQLTLTSVEYLNYHQWEEDRVKARFPARPVWGVHDDDHDEISDIIIEALKN